MFPAQALAEAMLHKGWRVKLVHGYTRRPLHWWLSAYRLRLLQVLLSHVLRAVDLLGQSAMVGSENCRRRCHQHGDADDARIVRMWLWALAAIRQSRRWVRRQCLKIPRMIHEQNGILGQGEPSCLRRRVSQGWPAVSGLRHLPEGAESAHVTRVIRFVPPFWNALAAGLYPSWRISDVDPCNGRQSGRAHSVSDIVPGAIAGFA